MTAPVISEVGVEHKKHVGHHHRMLLLDGCASSGRSEPGEYYPVLMIGAVRTTRHILATDAALNDPEVVHIDVAVGVEIGEQNPSVVR